MSTQLAAPSESRPGLASIWLGRLFVILLLAAAWQWAPTQLWPSDLVSRPRQIVLAFWDMILDGTLWTSTWISIRALVQGTVISAAIGVGAAGLLFQSRLVERALNPVIALANAVPKFVFIPVYLGIFGLGETPKLLLLVSYMPFIYFYQALNGMHSVEKEVRDSMRFMGARNVTIFRLAALPAAASRVMTATRIAVPLGFTLVVFAEIWASTSGLGYVISYNYSLAQVDRAMVGIVWIFTCGLALDAGLRVIERRANRWRTS